MLLAAIINIFYAMELWDMVDWWPSGTQQSLPPPPCLLLLKWLLLLKCITSTGSGRIAGEGTPNAQVLQPISSITWVLSMLRLAVSEGVKKKKNKTRNIIKNIHIRSQGPGNRIWRLPFSGGFCPSQSLNLLLLDCFLTSQLSWAVSTCFQSQALI